MLRNEIFLFCWDDILKTPACAIAVWGHLSLLSTAVTKSLIFRKRIMRTFNLEPVTYLEDTVRIVVNCPHSWLSGYFDFQVHTILKQLLSAVLVHIYIYMYKNADFTSTFLGKLTCCNRKMVYQKGKQKSPGRATSRSCSQLPTPGGKGNVTQINVCRANKQMHDKHKDQLPLPQARWSKC